ncbi:5-formyltetrahydrofolate cyclo-ligase [bacterium]|nr:5-formyltetrahydrofolate cyclo-ligase [bacterium]|tara:strand:+ start:274 stop:846 length:573 start_codon:yes stop_codon:yes gene_type:complete
MITKRVVRQAVKARQALLTDVIRKRKSESFNQQLNLLLETLTFNTVACFLPMNQEPDLDINGLLSQYQVIVPKYMDGMYKFVHLRSLDEVTEGPYGIFEPKDSIECDSHIVQSDYTVFLVPGLAFDYMGNRVGYGKGIYDRLLEFTKGVRIGLCFHDQLFSCLPTDFYDQRMMYVVHDEDFFPCVGEDGY